MRHRCRLGETGWAEFGYFLCYFNMVAPRALVFRPLVKGNGGSGNKIEFVRICEWTLEGANEASFSPNIDHTQAFCRCAAVPLCLCAMRNFSPLFPFLLYDFLLAFLLLLSRQPLLFTRRCWDHFKCPTLEPSQHCFQQGNICIGCKPYVRKTKTFSTAGKNNFVSEQQTLFPQQMFFVGLKWKIFASATMFPSLARPYPPVGRGLLLPQK